MLCAALFLLSTATASWVHANSSLVRIPREWTYVLPHPFDSKLQYSWLNSTTTGNSTINELLARANEARFVSYSDEFDALVGPDPSWYTVESPAGSPYAAYEGGTWIPETDEVWFSYSGFYYPYEQSITSYSLRNRTSRPVVTTPPVRYTYGLYYWPDDGKVYATEFDTPTQPGTITAIDLKTLEAKAVFNSYEGIPLAPCDDVVVARVHGKTYIYATTLAGKEIIPAIPKERFDTAVWRFSLDDNILLPVIDSNELFTPNGIRVSPDGKKLYVTNTPYIHDPLEQASNTSLSNSIHVYDLDDEGFPVNGRLFGLVRTGFANGLHIDNAGRIWTAENDGVRVRSPNGLTLGVFNYHPFNPTDSPLISNFALAGNRLVIGNLAYVLVYNLAEMLVTLNNSLTN
ncbi:hypothetical protein M409DRAFT_48970 [Zasmidium cellare ATCC 36951]|uniref:SMP-30/Gluconolactonase/LRE-like region domain-containing protein n=1 Tax=Zasmidium cellare ATCC 36951 TaxID=1080233 RepID=A0A6A6D3V1_ZASCE|nr:uncharacterized protein M409DRAFT_48970 [Zasmidium cellare ATCC 36951]KAF2174091.1 hypothetical protein M409DRAFT_48970 [Zasmidium cellare ATCC 36951]